MSIPRTRSPVAVIAVGLGLALALAVSTGATRAHADPGDDDFLGEADSFAIVASATITSTGPTLVTGDVALHPGTAVGLLAEQVLATIHTPADLDGGALALAVRNALISPYDQLLGAMTSTGSATGVNVVDSDLVSYTPPGSSPGLYQPGVYASASSLGLSGPIVLDGGGNSDAVFIFRAETAALTVASGSTVTLVGGAQWCNVYWQVGTSATIGTNAAFVGTVLANASIAAQTGATITGRLLASAGAGGAGEVTLDSNVIDAAQGCSSGAGVVGPDTGPGPGPEAAPGAGPGVGPDAAPGSGLDGLPSTGSEQSIAFGIAALAVIFGVIAVHYARRPRGRV